MANLSQVSDLVERLSDDQLQQELQQPSGMAPLFVVMSEIQRRAQLRGGKPRGYSDGGAVRPSWLQDIWGRLEQRESRGQQLNPDGTPLTSRAGAFGVAQLMPGTAEEVAGWLGDPSLADRARTDPAVNRRLGQAYLQRQYDDFGGVPELTLAAYNAGPGRVREWINRYGDPRTGQISAAEWASRIPFEETRNYVSHILGSEDVPIPPTPQTPYNMGQNTLDILDILNGRTLPGGVRTDADYARMAGEALPDRASPIFDDILNQQNKSLARHERESRGRALMEMGIAMMGAQTPSFLAALGQGGAAGLGARDRLQAQRAGIEQGINQTRMGQAQTLTAQDAARLQARTAMRGQDVDIAGRNISAAAQLGLGGAQLAQGDAELDYRRQNDAADRAFAETELRFRQDRDQWERTRAGVQDRREDERWQAQQYQSVAQELTERYVSMIPQTLAYQPEAYQAAVDAAVARAQQDAASIVSGRAPASTREGRPPLSAFGG